MPYRGVNVSQYVANLNSINPSHSSPESLDDTFQDDDLALFATTQFFDFEMGQPEKEEVEKQKTVEVVKSSQQQAKPVKPESSSVEFLDDLNDLGFDYSELLPVFPNPTEEQLLDTLALSQAQQSHIQPSGLLPRPSLSTSHPVIQLQPLQPQPQTILPQPSSSLISLISPITPTQPALISTLPPHLKRKSIVLDSPLSSADSPEDSGYRNAADEDKRRRNTAASARFRIKKKQREQALEVHAKELEAKCQQLQEKIKQLETENKWLKNLITDKKDLIPESVAEKSVEEQ